MKNIIVLTFHTIFDHDTNRPWSFLSDSVKAFENTLKTLKRKGYETISLREFYELKEKKVDDKRKRVILNFDDGFLDNFTIVFPLLKKYEMKATVYVSPDFVDKRNIVRPFSYPRVKNSENVALEGNWGYMSWAELKILDESGVIDVQCHAMTHTWYYSSPILKDVHYCNSPYYWLWWNKYPTKKPIWLTDYNETEVEYGYPIFEYSKSLSGKIFIPNKEVLEYIVAECNKYDISSSNERQKTIEIIKNKLSDNFKEIGTYETDDDFINRIRYELIESKKICETMLNKKIEFLAWPGGAVCDEAKEIAKEAGFLAYTSKEKHYNNTLSDPINCIYRLGGWSGVKIKGKISPLFERIFLSMQLYRAKGEKNIINRFFDMLGNVYRNRHIKKCKKSGENWK